MAQKSIVIVGGGIAGLAAGCYAQMNGYKATILEMHQIPGGLCTAWKRKGYTFDSSMHMLIGSQSGPFHKMWKELGVVPKRQFHYHSEMLRLEGLNKSISFTTKASDIEQQMFQISPADKKHIKEFVALISGPSGMNAMPLEASELQRPLKKAGTFFSIAPLLPTYFKCGNQTIQDFAERFQDPFLRRAVRSFIDTPGWPMVQYPLAAMAGLIETTGKNAGVPLGGSKEVVFGIAERFQALGGVLRCNSKVEDLIVENDRAAGIVLEGGEEIYADTVIWAADGHHLIFDLLKEMYVNEEIRNRYNNWIPVRSLVHVCLGVARDMTNVPAKIVFELEQPISVAGERRRWLSVFHRGFDKAMAPEGKTALEVWYPSRYEYWEELATRPEDYTREKKHIADLTIAKLEDRWPGFAKDIEVVDVPTPMTYVRYTGNWKGSPDGWYVTPQNMRAEPLRTLPGLSDLLMVGQWTAPFTGTVIGSLSGRQAIEILCHRDGVQFQTTAQ